MSLLKRLTDDMKTAMKARDSVKLGTVRMLISELKNAAIANRGSEMTEAEEIDMLARQAKRRREAMDAFEQAGRDELFAQEKAELAIIETYLPQQLSVEDVTELARQAIEATGAAGMGDMGKVMSSVMPQLRGRFPGKEVQPIVRGLLQG